jgi:hypothetical protein
MNSIEVSDKVPTCHTFIDSTAERQTQQACVFFVTSVFRKLLQDLFGSLESFLVLLVLIAFLYNNQK